MPMFRKKPVEIEARQMPANGYTVPDGEAQMGALADWCGGEVAPDAVDGSCIFIETLEGTMKARPGDWIIRGVAGEFYPCAPEIFAATYEAV